MNQKEVEEIIEQSVDKFSKRIEDLESKVSDLESEIESMKHEKEHPFGCQCTSGCA